MLGTVPKLKEFGIKWATLDDRWFDTYGDWNPRNETFPGDSIKKMDDDFHKQGILVQLWWLPLARGRWTGQMGVAQVHRFEGCEGASGVADSRQGGKARPHDTRPGDAVSGGTGSAGLLQEADREVYRRVGLRRLQAGQHLQRHRCATTRRTITSLRKIRSTPWPMSTRQSSRPAALSSPKRDPELSLRHAAVTGLAAFPRSGGNG